MIQKRGNIMVRFIYGCFLNNMASIAPTNATAMIIAIVEITKYISVGGKATAGCDVGVGTTWLTTKRFQRVKANKIENPEKLQ
jgi:hypothetical protein